MVEVKYLTSTDTCSCPDFQYRGRERPCKHVVALVEAYRLIAATAAKWQERAVV